MWKVGLCVVGVIVVWFTRWINKWRNPKCNGILPPGSMGPPLIGESLQLIIPSYSLDLHPFIKKRVQRYGPIFRTSVAGQPMVVSTDVEFNHYLAKQEGRLVHIWYLDSFAEIFNLEDENTISRAGHIHKYARSIILNHFGTDSLKEKLLSQIEEFVNKTLQTWSSLPSVEVKHASSVMTFDLFAKQCFDYDVENSAVKISEKFLYTLDSLISFPLNIPGTAYHKCLKDKKEALNMLRDIVKERMKSPEKYRGDFLDQITADMNKESFLTQDFIIYLLYGLLFASFESISASLSLTLKLLAEHPAVLLQLTAEHEAILKNREDPKSTLTWHEYKSMTFTFQVINEALRLGNVIPGLLRRALKDIEFKGYTIPAGWTIMLANTAIQLNPNTYEDPLAFNPWRWQDLEPQIVSKNFMPFGGGIRQCAGAEYSKTFLATFLHVLVTKYRWTKVKGGKMARNPILWFADGIHINFSLQNN
ncbi:cucurbitadienol 11-hydroxylase-like [Juglans microcarpa x Juglans regia]|uniref:cucurbitadienol 11-hydroxylase-like n=1 Tax=Juglans microcarpa x Juglans regia TaxID=2249226 RepID=UPI001B7E7706|nr:cucurbitadienol 11-hydroxylase-like [Juglans microcarpa x Juglans regia]